MSSPAACWDAPTCRPGARPDRTRRTSCATAAPASAASASAPPSPTSNDRIAPHLIGHDVAHQRALDAALIELDGTEDKSALGANAILGVSLAAARAAAAAHELPLYRYLNANAHVLPIPQVNLINGGRHASNDLDFQEFIMIPSGAESMLHALQIATEVNLQLGEILLDKFGKAALNTGDEGGYAPPLSDPEEALGYLHEAVGRAGYDDLVSYGLDCAATHYYDAATETYLLAGQRHDRAGMIELYQRLIARFGIVTIEDPLHEDDFEGFAELTEASGIQIVGDDLFVTNPARLARGIEAGAANSLLWKVNQIGTLSEALDAADQAYRHGYTVVVSERSGETEDRDHRRPVGGAERGTDQDRRAGAGRAHRQVQRAAADRRGAGNRRRLPDADGVAHRAGGMSATGSGIPANREALVAGGPAPLRELVLDIVEAGVRAADPEAAVRAAVSLGEGGAVIVDGVSHMPGPGGRVLVLGAGKASARIATTLEQLLGDVIAGGVVVAPDGHAVSLDRIELLSAGHPLPTEASCRAAQRLMQLAKTAGPEDVVLACFTGGSSALACLPADGVSFEEKRELHRLLLGSGAAIREINAVRKHVSGLKGGRLAAAMGGASVVNLTVSDVVGDPLDAITDPTVTDTTTGEQAIAVLHAYDLWDAVAPSIRRHLTATVNDAAPQLDDLSIQSLVLVTGADVANAMVRRSTELGVTAHVVSTTMEGESREIGTALAAIAVEIHDHGRPFARPCVLVGAGGETTVTLTQSEEFGLGGPNQAAALAAALRIGAGRSITAAFLDTDGMDGGTEVAGALVDGSTLERAVALEIDLRTALLRHRSSEVLTRLGDTIVTGQTGSNVNDLFAIAVGPA